MSFVSIARRLLSGGEPSVVTAPAGRRRRAALAATRLEDRTTPVVNLIDVNSSFTGGGNSDSLLLGQSRDGRFAIFASKSTDLVDGVADNPNTLDLFWTDLALPGNTKMVSSLNNKSFGSILTADGFAQAQISGDGKFVAFSTKVNAATLDPAYQATQDSANTTLDVFRWEAANETFRLASRTYNQDASNPTVAVGLFTDATEPGLTVDGSKVGFVSGIKAGLVLPQRNSIIVQNKVTFDLGPEYRFVVADDSNSSDVFVTDFTPGRADSGGFADNDVSNVKFITNVVSSYGGDLNTVNRSAVVGGNLELLSRTFNAYVTVGSKSVGGVAVDPFGRYLNDIGSAFTFRTAFNPDNLNVFPASKQSNPDFAAANTPGVDAFLTKTAFSTLNGELRVVSAAAGTGTRTTVGATGGRVDVAVIAGQTSDQVLISTVGGASPNAKASPNPAGGDLYLVRADGVTPTTGPVLVTSVSGSLLNSPGTGGLQLFDTNVLNPTALYALNADQVDPGAVSVTTDGRLVAFSSNTKASVYTNNKVANGVGAAGAVFNVFVKDTNSGLVRVASVTPATVPTASAAGGVNPRISSDGRFVSFDSKGTDLVTGQVDKNNTFDAFVRDLVLNATQLLSNTGTGSKAGNQGVVAGRTFVNSSPLGQAAYAAFNSFSTDLRPDLPLTTGKRGTFSVPLSVATTPQVSKAQLVGAVSAGNGQVAFVSYGASGNSTLLGNRFTPFPGFTGEIRAATYTVTVANPDGTTSTFTNMVAATGPGAGGPRVAIIDGAQSKVVRTFLAFEASFTGGVYVAAGNNASDGSPVLALGAGEGGGARLKLLTLNPASTAADPQNDFRTQADFFAFEASFRGGVRPGLGDFGSLFPADDPTQIGAPTPVPDGAVDLVAAAGEGGGPRVSIFDGARLRGSIPPQIGFTDPTTVPSAAVRLSDFFVFETRLRNGAFVAAGDFNSDGVDDLVAGAGPGGGPRVTVFDGRTTVTTPVQPTVLSNFFALDPESSRAGVRVAVKNIDGDASADIMTGSGVGTPPQVRTFAGGRLDPFNVPTLLSTIIPFDQLNLNGAWVG